jgi:hypothetical protein
VKNFLKIGLVALLTYSATSLCVADNCITQGDAINLTHSLQSTSLDPYSHLLPDLVNTNNLATTYDLNLKPLVVNDLTRLQFETRDSRSPAAGYTSPYLWEVGQGPGYRGRYQLWNGSAQPATRFSPIPMPVRR